MINVTQADVVEWLATLPDESATACFCDPPYGLKFMGKDWDHGVPSADVWREVWRVLKPGGLLLAFGGTRTWHRLAVNIEDAGFELFDTFMWVYGQGFPKSANIGKMIDKEAGAQREVVGTYHGATNISNVSSGLRHDCYGIDGDKKQNTLVSITAPATPDAATWDGYGTAAKPAWEPCLMFRKPRRGTYAQTAVTHGTGALNIDGCRVGVNNDDPNHRPNGTINTPSSSLYGLGHGVQRNVKLSAGRWPANLALVHDERCNGACHPECPVRLLGEQSGERPGNNNKNLYAIEMNNQVYGKYDHRETNGMGRNDTGTAARFFYQAKASRREREAGLEDGAHIPSLNRGSRWCVDCGKTYNGTNDHTKCSGGVQEAQAHRIRNGHPTVKPLAVCEYMARLILPPEPYRDDAVLLVPYAGSGSECIGAFQAGWRNVEGCELEAEYVEIARRRIDHWCKQPALIGV